MIEFPFQRRESLRLGKILKPIIPVSVIGPRKTIDIFMLLDSGADVSMVPYSAGEALGLTLDMKARSEVHGIGEGTVPYILVKVKYRIGEIEVPARTAWALIEEVPFILGRLDMFQVFAIEFREFENRILFKQPSE